MKYVAFLDILGFKEIIDNNSLQVISESYHQAFKSIYDRAYMIFGKSYGFDKSDAIINSLIVSDSIIIWTNDANYNSFCKLIFIVRSMLYNSIDAGLPLRGAIDLGELLEVKFDELEQYNARTSPIILGNGLTKAYQLESNQQWSGCVISDECIEFMQKNRPAKAASINEMEEIGLILKYNIPFKKGKIRQSYSVNWPTYYKIKLTEKVIRDAFKAHNKKTDDWDIEYKIRNTIAFNNYSLGLSYKLE